MCQSYWVLGMGLNVVKILFRRAFDKDMLLAGLLVWDTVTIGASIEKSVRQGGLQVSRRLEAGFAH